LLSLTRPDLVAAEPYHFEFMAEAIREAEISIAEGGLPIGAVLTRDKKIIARGHNRRVQEKNVILHGEMSCLRNAGLMSFHDTVMYTTLSPCSMCAGAIGLFKLLLLVIGESVTFPGSKDILTRSGIPFIDLADERSIKMMQSWRSIPANERLWQGDIGN
jgi:cytosine deaminase